MCSENGSAPFVAREGRVPGEPRLRVVVGRHLADGDGGAARRRRRHAPHEQPADDALGTGDVAHRGDDAPVAAAVELLHLDHVDGVRAERPPEARQRRRERALRERRVLFTSDRVARVGVEALRAAAVQQLAQDRRLQARQP